LAYATRFPEALAQLLKGTPSVISGATNETDVRQQATPENTAVAGIRSLVDRANRALADYRRLTSEGKLGEAGAKLDELNRTLEEMNRATPRQ